MHLAVATHPIHHGCTFRLGTWKYYHNLGGVALDSLKGFDPVRLPTRFCKILGSLTKKIVND
jgi:hypothetical protein